MIVTRTKHDRNTNGVGKQFGGAVGSVLMLACAAVLFGSLAQAQTKYRSAEEAWRVGVAFLSSRNFAASREPFEAALQMAPDDKFRLKVYEALLPAYRQLGEIDKFVEACDFLIAKSPTPAQQSMTRRALLAFVFERGQLDELARLTRLPTMRREDRVERHVVLIEQAIRGFAIPPRFGLLGGGPAVRPSGGLFRQFDQSLRPPLIAEFTFADGGKYSALCLGLLAWSWLASSRPVACGGRRPPEPIPAGSPRTS